MPLSSGTSDVILDDGDASTGDSMRDTDGMRYLKPKQESSELPVFVCITPAVFGVDVETRLGVQIATRPLDRSDRHVDIGGDITRPLSSRDVSLLVTVLLANRMLVRCLEGPRETSALSSDECSRFLPVLLPLFWSAVNWTWLPFLSVATTILFFGPEKAIFDRQVVDGFFSSVSLTERLCGLLSGDNSNLRHSSDCSKA